MQHFQVNQNLRAGALRGDENEAILGQPRFQFLAIRVVGNQESKDDLTDLEENTSNFSFKAEKYNFPLFLLVLKFSEFFHTRSC